MKGDEKVKDYRAIEDMLVDFVEEVYDWNVEFFKKNGYKIVGEIPDLPKGHSFYILEKFF